MRVNIYPILRVSGLTIVIIIVLTIVFFIYLIVGHAPATKVDFGVTFSKPFAQQLGLDWREAYLAILDDLKVEKIRLIAYWPEIEPKAEKYTFEDLDWQINEAAKRNIDVILAIGRKLPRWPECHAPDWAKDLSDSHQKTRILKLLYKIVDHYKENKTIKMWQVENEPILRGFGECPALDKDFLDREIALVISLDHRPTMLTTSGELSLWIEPAFRTKILGTTLYRDVNSRIGQVRYPLPPVFYYRRAELMKRLAGLDKVMIIELQAEPWGEKQIYEMIMEDQLKLMSLEKFKNIISYTKKAGLTEAYFWGAEWWYWLKDKKMDDSFWETAKEAIQE